MLSSLGASDAKLCNFLCVSVQPAQKTRKRCLEAPAADLEKSAENKVFSHFCADFYTREKVNPLCKKV
jgi:hypothetical protein